MLDVSQFLGKLNLKLGLLLIGRSLLRWDFLYHLNPQISFHLEVIMSFLNSIWSIIKKLKTAILSVILVLSIFLNTILFIGGSFYAAASSLFETVTGVRTIASQHASELSNVNDRLISEKKINRELKTEVGQLSDNLVSEKKISRELKTEMAGLSDNLLSEKKISGELKSQVAGLSDNLVGEKKISRELKTEMAGLSDNLLSEKKISGELKSQVAGISDNLANEQKIGRALKAKVARLTLLSKGLVNFRGKKIPIKNAVDLTADTISKRAVKTSKREVSSMAGEALPYFGTAVIVAVTAMELVDLCDTIQDMNVLKRAFDPNLNPSEEELTVCSIKIPTRAELVEQLKASPEKAWKAAKEATPTIEELKDIEIPDVDFKAVVAGSKGKATELWGSTQESSQKTYLKVKNWWEAE